jgi:GT2 family glycosyltransferase
MRQKGWRVVYLPQYEMVHFCQRVTNRRFWSRMGWKHIKGLLYFYWKHKSING